MASDDMRTPGLDDADSIEAMRRRHLAIGLRMQAIAVRALEELEAKVAARQPLGLSAGDAKTLLEAGTKLERAALDGKEPDEGEKPIPKAKKPN